MQTQELPKSETPTVTALPTPVVPAPNRKRNPLAIVGIVALVVLAIIGIYAWATHGEEDTDDAQVAADIVPVATRVAGQVVKINVAENEVVTGDKVIAEIDDADYAARFKQAEAELATAKAQAVAADNQVRVVEASSRGGLASARAFWSGSSASVGSATAQVLSSKAMVQQAEANLKKAEIDLTRAKQLRAENAVPQERVDNTQAAFDTASAALAQAKAGLAQSEETRRVAETRVTEAKGRLDQSSPIDAQIATARAQADLAHARVTSAEAQLELARLNLGYTKIKPPANGIASKLTAHPGQLLTIGQPIFELVPTETYVVANFKETQVGKMKKGQKATIKVDAFPGKKFSGTVESLSGGTGASFSLIPADNASGNFVKVVQRVPVRIKWDKPPEGFTMRAGMSAEVVVEVKD
jgi:membrane fusion protein (multidrug efflux system)